MQCGGTITEFEKMTLGDVFDVINTHVDMQQEQIKQREKQQKKQSKGKNKSSTNSEKFSFGRAPELDTDFFKF